MDNTYRVISSDFIQVDVMFPVFPHPADSGTDHLALQHTHYHQRHQHTLCQTQAPPHGREENEEDDLLDIGQETESDRPWRPVNGAIVG